MPIPDAPPASDLEVGDSLPDALEGLRATAQATKDAVGEDLPEDLAGLGQPDVGAALQAHSNAIAQEVTDRTAAVAAEADARVAAIAAVQADVDTNEADADAAIATVQADVDANEAAATAAVSAEAAARASADAALRADLNVLGSELARLAVNEFVSAVAEVGSAEGLDHWVYEAYLTDDRHSQSPPTSMPNKGSLVRGAGLHDGYFDMLAPHDDRRNAESVNGRAIVADPPTGTTWHVLPSAADRVLLLTLDDLAHSPVTTAPTFTRASIGHADGTEFASGQPRLVQGPNLLSAGAANFQSGMGTSGWLSWAGSGTPSLADAVKLLGDRSLGITMNGGSTAAVRNDSVRVTAGKTYTFFTSAYTTVADRECRVVLTYLDKDGSVLATNDGDFVTMTTGTWMTLPAETALAPAGAVQARIGVYMRKLSTSTAPDNGDVLYIDKACMREGTSTQWVPGGRTAVLVEEATTNLLTDPTTAGLGGLTNVTRTSGHADPFGGTAAALLTETTADGLHNGQWAFPESADQRTASVYAKRGPGSRNIRVFLENTANQSADFDLATGAVSNIGSGLAGAYAVPIGGGWWRCVVISQEAIPRDLFHVRLLSGSTQSYAGDGVSGVYLAYPQVEAKTYATSWQDPTDGARAAETVTFNAAQALDTDQGSIEVQFYVDEARQLGTAPRAFATQRAGGSNANLQLYLQSTGEWRALIRDTAGTTVAVLACTGVPTRGWVTARLAWTGREFKLDMTGATQATDTASADLDSFGNGTSSYIGTGTSSSFFLNTPIAAFRLSNRDRSADPLPTVLTMDGDTTWMPDLPGLVAVDRDLTVTYEATVNGGGAWQEVTPGELTTMTTPGTQFAVRVNLARPDGSNATGRIYWAAALAGAA